MVVGRGGPDLTKPAFGYQVLVAHSVPEGAADCANVSSSVEDGANHFHFAGPGIAVFAYVAVEAQRTVVASLAHVLLLEEMNRKNRCVPAVAAPQRERSISQVRESINRASADRHDLGGPAEIGVAHGNGTTGVAAPLIGLQVGEVCVPSDINRRRGFARLSKQSKNLRLIALK